MNATPVAISFGRQHIWMLLRMACSLIWYGQVVYHTRSYTLVTLDFLHGVMDDALESLAARNQPRERLH